MFLVPSNALGTAPTFVTSTDSRQLSLGVNFAASGNIVTSYSASLMMYAGTAADGLVHIFGLDLSNVAVVPTPIQIGALTVSDSSLICSYTQAQTSASDPKTLFLVLEVAGTGGDCNSSTVPHVFEVVRYVDAATVAPTVVNIGTTDITFLYSGGSLTGLVLLDSTNSALNFYSNNGFTSPTTLVAGASQSFEMSYTGIHAVNILGTSDAFFDVTVGTTEYLYRVTPAGVATKLLTAAGSLSGNSVADTANLYFTDFVSGTSITFYQEALTGSGVPLALYTATPPGGSRIALVGSNGSRVVFDQVLVANDGSTSTSFFSIPAGQASTTPATIGTPLTGSVNAFLAAANSGSPASSKLFVNLSLTSTTGTTSTTSLSTLIYDPSGPVLQPPLANSVFQEGVILFLNSVVQFQGITATDGSYGGSSPYSFDIASQATTVFKTLDGSPYVVPSATSAYLFPLSTSIGEVGLYGSTQGAAAFDLSQLLVVPVTVASSAVTPL